MFEKRSDLVRFLAVVETGGVGTAAERLDMTQPGVGRCIARLEREFAAALSTTGVRPTPRGASCASAACSRCSTCNHIGSDGCTHSFNVSNGGKRTGSMRTSQIRVTGGDFLANGRGRPRMATHLPPAAIKT